MVNQCLRRHPALVAESHYRYLTRWRTQLAAVQISAIYERCEATFLIFGRFVWIQVILLQFLEVAVKITHAEIDRDVVLVVVSNSNVFVYHAASDSGSFACMTIPPTYSIFGSGMSAKSFIFESPAASSDHLELAGFPRLLEPRLYGRICRGCVHAERVTGDIRFYDRAKIDSLGCI